MIKIIKDEPDFFINAKKKVKLVFVSSAWKEIGKKEKDFKKILREYILKEQYSLCAYCEKEITASSIDHFKTRDACPRETLNYDNLFISCNSKSHCEKTKDKFGLVCNDYQKIVNPIIENPDDFFEYGLAGDILVKDRLTNIQKEKAKFTIKVFNLDDTSLIIDRRRVVDMLQLYKNQDFKLNRVFNFLPDYKSFIECIYPKLKKEELK